MKRHETILIACFFFTMVSAAFGMQGHSSGEGHEDGSARHNTSSPGQHEMRGDGSDHVSMDHGSGIDGGGTFKREMMADGVHAEFQVMRLESMKMTDDQGNTHHIMVKMFTDGKKQQAKEAIGKIKVIAPDGKEQVKALKNYSGILAANFTFPQPGKYGVICLAKVDGQKKVFKFWYTHQ